MMNFNWDVRPGKSRPCTRLACDASTGLYDYFDKLPDPVVLLILNQLADIKALGRCCAVSKRFRELALQVDNVVVKVDCVLSGDESRITLKGKGLLSHFVRFVFDSIVKPFQALHQFLGPKKSILAEVSHHSPCEVLKNFKALQQLRIELPAGELGMEGGLLKWKAEFGSTLESCIIIGAASVENNLSKAVSKFDSMRAPICDSPGHRHETDGLAESEAFRTHEESESIPDSFYSDGGLKLRVIWTISSLIAASARHFLLHQIIAEHPTLEGLILGDADGQGMLCMSKEQLQDFRNKPFTASASANRTQVPDLNMKLWYAPYLELPGNLGLRGATLVAVRPSECCEGKISDERVTTAFQEPFKSAVDLLARRRTYSLEMNSF